MSIDVKWPGVLDYIGAVQNAGASFKDPELRTARFETDDLGAVTSSQGQTATVFFADAADRQVAVRCFNRAVRNGAERYRRLGEHLRRLPAPVLAGSEWLDDGVVVGGQTWPVVKMEQVNGMALGRYVEEHLHRPEQLRGLAEQWRHTAELLCAASIAHGDLQQDNIIVMPDGRLRLIDLDSVWVPGLAGLAPDENGHRNFQHPERLATGVWHRHIDAFPALVIYLSLRAVAAAPDLWEHNNGENLILLDTDFQQPGVSGIWARLSASPDLEVRDLTQLLMTMCLRSARVEGDLGQILVRMQAPEGPRWTSAPPAAYDVERWWTVEGDEPPSADEPFPELTLPRVRDAGRSSATQYGSALRRRREARIRALIFWMFILVVALIGIGVWSVAT